MDDNHKKIMKFMKSSWTNINIRCGKYKHLQTISKCKSYEGLEVLFSRKEYKDFCFKHEEVIINLEKPSVDRIDSSKSYSLDNIRFIELSENIRIKKYGNQYHGGRLSNAKRGVRSVGKKFAARITNKSKEKHLGVFETQEEAYEAYKKEYINIYGKEPF